MTDLQEVDRRNVHHNTTLGEHRDHMEDNLGTLTFHARVIGSLGSSVVDDEITMDADHGQPKRAPIELQEITLTSTRTAFGADESG